ncbi:MAG: hypothetical protein M0T74_01545 [Desulfitobacterium hafniense]|nr:hypothetical protein [Desulfitobacterium hafniense]
MSTKNSMPTGAGLKGILQQMYEFESAPYRYPLDMPYLGLIPQPGVATAAQAVGQAQSSKYWSQLTKHRNIGVN